MRTTWFFQKKIKKMEKCRRPSRKSKMSRKHYSEDTTFQNGHVQTIGARDDTTIALYYNTLESSVYLYERHRSENEL